MKMTPDYLAETLERFVGAGFALEESVCSPEGTITSHRRFELSRGQAQKLVFESLVYQDGTFRFYLEIARYHDIRTFSLELDSWKHFADRVEIRYRAVGDSGRSLAFIFSLVA